MNAGIPSAVTKRDAKKIGNCNLSFVGCFPLV